MQHFIIGIQTLSSELNAAQAQTRHQSVRAKIGIMSSDLNTVASDLDGSATRRQQPD